MSLRLKAAGKDTGNLQEEDAVFHGAKHGREALSNDKGEELHICKGST